ncbi:Slam-dependent surface lipoprotein [Brenneria tiliae]|uniref:Transferrin-binding protein B C-lobe/N-lobe beta barrel domain-containing protein n=1 Tax=Brenneria tiliae TaxID=2914984 RepID=A0ABT0MPX7_9GAMM|nr:Slam-dependent surface lipoprotein [Brenneria tiliae]MCL2891677.1 hypothetical protein [Brenneria tiliae]
MNILLKKTLLALAIASAAGLAQADIVGGQTDTNSPFYVDTATFGTIGAAGAGVEGQINDEVASFSHFARPAYYNSTTDAYNVSGRQLVADGAPGSGQYDHSGIGVWSFAQVGSEDVWYGTWSEESTSGAVGTKVAGTHNAWYVGEDSDVATTLPASATYTVRSINNSTQTATSVLSATFNGGSNGTASSTGDITFSGGSINTAGNDVQLAASGVSVASNSGTGGSLTGNFYGNGASSVAGVVAFANRDLNTAFGGAKN